MTPRDAADADGRLVTPAARKVRFVARLPG